MSFSPKNEPTAKPEKSSLVLLNEGKPLFEGANWDFTTLQRVDFFAVFIDANDVMTKISKACPRNQTNIARSDHYNPHFVSSSIIFANP